MKHSQRIVITLLVFILSAGAVTAQQRSAAPSLDTLAAREAYFLSVKLKLNLEQKVRVYQLTRTNMAQMDSVRRLALADPSGVLTRLAKDYRSALKGVFTASQYTGYEGLLEEQKKHFRQKAKQASELPL